MVPVLPVPVHEVGRRSISVEWTMFGVDNNVWGVGNGRDLAKGEGTS